MKRFIALLLCVFMEIPGMAWAGQVIKRGPASNVFHGITESGTGDESTLAYLNNLRSFEALENNFTARLWVDPFTGNDATGTGSYALPFKSFSKIKTACLTIPHMRCSVKGKGRVFSPLTYTLSGISNENYIVGELANTAALTVLAWDAATNTIVVARNTGADPVIADTITGATSGAAGTVATRADTLGGQPTITPTSVTVATDIFTFVGHPYVNNQGPMRWYEATDSTTLTGITEQSVDYYICDVVAGVSFTVDTDSDCSGASNNIGGTLTAGSQWTGYQNTQVTNAITPACGTTYADKFCSIMDTEFPEWPATIDGNGYYPNGLTAVAATSWFWNGQAANGLCASSSCTPANGFVWVSGDGNDGWIGWQNITVQNISLDAFSNETGSNAGKLVVLNSPGVNIRNGTNDRSTLDEGNAHNSVVSSLGQGTDGSGGALGGGVIWFLNGGGSSNDSGSNIASGAPFNPNQEGMLIAVGTGSITTNGISGDTQCGGTLCASPIVQGPSGDLVIIGHDLVASTLSRSGVISSQSNVSRRHQIYRTLMRLPFTADTNGYAIQVGDSDGTTAAVYTMDLNEVTARFYDTGDQDFLDQCGWASNASAVYRFKNVLVDDLRYWVNATACGLGHSSNTNFTRTTMNWTGIYDDEEGGADGTENEWLITATGYTTKALFDAAVEVIQPSVWTTMSSGSFNSNGESEGFQLGATPDVASRCLTGKECYHAATGGDYVASFMTSYGTDPSFSCLPAEVMGRRLCNIVMTPNHIGAR